MTCQRCHGTGYFPAFRFGDNAPRLGICGCYGWRPIADAPKDRAVLLRQRRRVGEGYWEAAYGSIRGSWRWANHQPCRPTHYQPLPEPPEENDDNATTP